MGASSRWDRGPPTARASRTPASRRGSGRRRCARSSFARRASVTPTCAANLVELIAEGVEGRGSKESVWEALAGLSPVLRKISPDDLARQLLQMSVAPLEKTVAALLEEHDLDRALVTLIGAGGGAAVLVPFLASRLGVRSLVLGDAAFVGAMGCDSVRLHEATERCIIAPTQLELLATRREVIDRLTARGATRDSVTVELVVDPCRNSVRATGSGATAAAVPHEEPLPAAEMVARASLGLDEGSVAQEVGATDRLVVFTVREPRRSRWPRPPGQETLTRVVDRAGTIRLSRRGARVLASTVGAVERSIDPFLDGWPSHGDLGRELPAVVLVLGNRIVDLSGVANAGHLAALVVAQIEGLPANEPLFLIATPRT
ncbi:MAG: hypothetical protein HY815_26500 [Candidatus Riflebacteria bacterium]|nr:hypothetical protein [Candidatus Riflebacteria bacterium]